MVADASSPTRSSPARPSPPTRHPLAPDAVPFRATPTPGVDLLPDWYMPRPARGRATPARRVVAIALVASALIINGLGFCITYGHLTAG